MAKSTKPVPEGYHTVTPYLIINGASDAIAFYKKALNATELMRYENEGKIGHAEMQIGDSKIMLADEYPEMGIKSPTTYGGSPVGLHLYVEDVDALFNQAVENGAKVQRPLQDQFYGDRSGSIEDPYGHVWYISTHKEDLTFEEMEKKKQAAQK